MKKYRTATTNCRTQLGYSDTWFEPGTKLILLSGIVRDGHVMIGLVKVRKDGKDARDGRGRLLFQEHGVVELSCLDLDPV